MADVARAARVSTATVSRVLNGGSGVSTDTVERVRSVVEAMNYRPMRVRAVPGPGGAARAAGKTGNIAVVTLGQGRGWFATPVMATALDSICVGAASSGYRVVLGEVLDLRAPQSLLDSKQIDGAIAFVATNDVESVHALARRVPLVWVMGANHAIAIDHVTPDHGRIGYLGYAYLRDQGCKNVAFVTANPDWQLMRQRGQAFLSASATAPNPAQAFLVHDDPAIIDAMGKRVVAARNYEALADLIAAAKPSLDGLFFGNDRTMSAFYPLLRERGLRPGENVTLVGCDNEEARLSSLHPRPASIDVGAEQIGQRAVVRLLARLAQPDEPPITICVAPSIAAPKPPTPA